MNWNACLAICCAFWACGLTAAESKPWACENAEKICKEAGTNSYRCTAQRNLHLAKCAEFWDEDAAGRDDGGSLPSQSSYRILEKQRALAEARVRESERRSKQQQEHARQEAELFNQSSAAARNHDSPIKPGCRGQTIPRGRRVAIGAQGYTETVYDQKGRAVFRYAYQWEEARRSEHAVEALLRLTVNNFSQCQFYFNGSFYRQAEDRSPSTLVDFGTGPDIEPGATWTGAKKFSLKVKGVYFEMDSVFLSAH